MAISFHREGRATGLMFHTIHYCLPRTTSWASTLLCSKVVTAASHIYICNYQESYSQNACCLLLKEQPRRHVSFDVDVRATCQAFAGLKGCVRAEVFFTLFCFINVPRVLLYHCMFVSKTLGTVDSKRNIENTTGCIGIIS